MPAALAASAGFLCVATANGKRKVWHEYALFSWRDLPSLGKASRDAEEHLATLSQAAVALSRSPRAEDRLNFAEGYDALVALTHANPQRAMQTLGQGQGSEHQMLTTAVITGLINIGLSKIEASDWLQETQGARPSEPPHVEGVSTSSDS